MATPKKKHLIELMIEAGVKWPDGAEYAAQDKCDNKVYFFNSKPNVYAGETHYCAPLGPVGNPRLLPSLCLKWHQTIVTREQYAEAVAAIPMTTAAQQEAKSNQVRESDDIPQSQQAPQYCASVMRQMPDNTIEQLTADYHAKAAEADRLQAVADDALKAADDALLALEKAGDLLGLVISIDTKPKQVGQHDITDWRDLRVGDVVEHIKDNGGSLKIGSIGAIIEICSTYVIVAYDECSGYVYSCPENYHKFKFIRRP